MTTESAGLLPELSTRAAYFDYLEGYAFERSDDPGTPRTRQGLVKTYMLETAGPHTPRLPALADLFGALNVHTVPVDEGLYQVGPQDSREVWGLLDQIDARYVVLHTLKKSEESDPWIRSLVQGSPWLDHVWLSASLFEGIWRYVSLVHHPSRYTRIAFEHEGFYDTGDAPGGNRTAWHGDLDEEDVTPTGDNSMLGPDDEMDDRRTRERRASRFTMVERIATVRQVLGGLQRTYKPLYSITQLRVPAPNRGGHDFFFNGKVTDRSDSFASHRQAVEYVLDLYRGATERAEQAAWFRLDTETRPAHSALPTPAGAEGIATAPREGVRFHGAPVTLKFSQPLPDHVFYQWVGSTFAHKQNRFRLWGNPIEMGKRKFHVHGVDRHVWQPLDLELTPTHVIALLPEGTCGNTIHRLVTNVQRFLDPAVEAWIGDMPYSDLFLAPGLAPAAASVTRR